MRYVTTGNSWCAGPKSLLEIYGAKVAKVAKVKRAEKAANVEGNKIRSGVKQNLRNVFSESDSTNNIIFKAAHFHNSMGTIYYATYPL